MNTRIQHYDLDEYSIDKFRDEGHVCLCDVGQAHELEPFRMAVNEATEKQGGVDIPLEERDTYGKAFQQHMNLWEIDDRVKEFILNPRYGKIAADLLGVNGVRIYHDQALYKEPGGGPTPWHQDQYYWPVTGSTITMWMPLVDISVDMGMLTFASRSHTEGYLGTLPISDESDEIFARYVRDKNFEVTRQSSMKAGDATFHNGWILHSAPGNSSQEMREVMTVIWVADGSSVTEPINDNQAADLARWLPGLHPGDSVNSKLNPVSYKRDET